MEPGKLDFEETADAVGILTSRGQVTLLYRIVPHLGAGVLRTLIRYCHQRLNQINLQEDGSISHNESHRTFVYN